MITINRVFKTRHQYLEYHFKVVELFAKSLKKKEREVLIQIILESEKSNYFLTKEVRKKVRIRHNLSLASLSNYLGTFRKLNLIKEDSINPKVLPLQDVSKYSITIKYNPNNDSNS